MNRIVLLFFLGFSFFGFSQPAIKIVETIEADIKKASLANDYNTVINLKKERKIWKAVEIAEKSKDTTTVKNLVLQVSEQKYITKNYSNYVKGMFIKGNYVKSSEKHSPYKKMYTKLDTNKNVTYPFPRSQQVNGRIVNEIGTINGIEVSYTYKYIDNSMDDITLNEMFNKDILKDNIFGTHKIYEVNLILVNKTKKKIVFDNPVVFAEVKFTGEKTYFQGSDGLVSVSGGECSLSTLALDVENKSSVMLPNKTYIADFFITQDASTLMGSLFLRRFKPLSVMVAIPNSHLGSGAEIKTSFPLFPDADLSDRTKKSEGNLIIQKISIPNATIDITPAYRGITAKNEFPQIDGFTQVFKNENLEVNVKIDDDYSLDATNGLKVYDIDIQIKNVGNMIIKPDDYPDGKIGAIGFVNAYEILLRLSEYSKKIDAYYPLKKFKPGEKFEYKAKIEITPFSGELLSGKEFKVREIDPLSKPMIAYVSILKECLRDPKDLISKSMDGKTRINVFRKLVEKEDERSEYDFVEFRKVWNASTHFIHMGNSSPKIFDAETNHYLKFESNESIEFPFMVRAYKIDEKKYLKDAQKRDLYPYLSIPKGNEMFIIVKIDRKIEFVTKEEFLYFLAVSEFDIKKTTHSID